MNKTTLPLFISGVLVGFGLCLMVIRKDAPPKVLLPTPAPLVAQRLEKIPPNPEVSTTTETAARPQVHATTAPRILEPEPVAVGRPIPEQPARDSEIDVDISEDDVAAIEESMPELRQDVQISADRRGWLVRFYKPDNALAAIGVQDNDLIRFEQFDAMKSDPTKEKLVGRLETLLKELER